MRLRLNLDKTQESNLKETYSFGLRWDKIGSGVDLDLFAIQIRNRDQFKFSQKVIYYNNPRSFDAFGSTRLTKLNVEGKDAINPNMFNLEVLITDLHNTPQDVKEILYCVSSPINNPFGNIPNCQFKVTDLVNDFNDVSNINLTQDYPNKNACVLYKIKKVYPDKRNNPSLFTWDKIPQSLEFSSGMRELLEYYYN